MIRTNGIEFDTVDEIVEFFGRMNKALRFMKPKPRKKTRRKQYTTEEDTLILEYYDRYKINGSKRIPKKHLSGLSRKLNRSKPSICSRAWRLHQ